MQVTSSLPVVGASLPSSHPSGAPYLTATWDSVLAPTTATRSTVNQGLSVVIVNSVSASNTFLKGTEPPLPLSLKGPRGLGGTHLAVTGQTYSCPDSDLTTSTSL